MWNNAIIVITCGLVLHGAPINSGINDDQKEEIKVRYLGLVEVKFHGRINAVTDEVLQAVSGAYESEIKKLEEKIHLSREEEANIDNEVTRKINSEGVTNTNEVDNLKKAVILFALTFHGCREPTTEQMFKTMKHVLDNEIARLKNN